MKLLIERLGGQALNKLIAKLLRQINNTLNNCLLNPLRPIPGDILKAKVKLPIIPQDPIQPIIIKEDPKEFQKQPNNSILG